MTQRIFDIENEKDMQDLWNILPDWAEKIKKSSQTYNYDVILSGNENYAKEACIFKINWHDKTEITRPIQETIEEATKKDIGKMCLFWGDGIKKYGVLTEIEIYYHIGEEDYGHCRRLTKQEIEELI